MEALRIESLSKDFGGVRALHDVSLSVESGERRAIIGANGAGKSTLIKLINGEITPSSGRVYIRGKEVTRMPVYDRVHLGVGRSCQINNLFLHISVLDNVLLALQATQPFRFQMLRSISKYGHLSVNAQELLTARGLWEKRDVPVVDLSYGEQRRIEVVLSLASAPKLLLLDEPTAGLSASETSDIMELVRGLGRDISVLFISHDMDVIFSIADRITVLHYGQVIAEGAPEEIRANPKVKQIYLGYKEG
jgi:branched-chain amino acid transport system ATP-binding protein